jgi:UDP-N-acetylmuramyl pentapeptide phosphotransferase/UDP-N-acetylglucosamine-1-phosphate transferase
MTLIELISAAILVAAATWAGTWIVLRILIRRGIYDRPNERSSHSQPKPRGGGLAVLAVLLLSWGVVFAVYPERPPGFFVVVAATLCLAAISWLDDIRSRPVALRLIVQFAAVGFGIAATAMDSQGFLVFQGVLPVWLDHLIKGLAWVWFINLFNFMDGVDGITGVETFCIGLGLALVALLTQSLQEGPAGASAVTSVVTSVLPAYPLMLAACAAGFLVWNWAPSKIFLGDVGSVTLGYLIGWLLLITAAQGNWPAALLLPLYYLADATLTLGRRALRGEKIWRGHREHFYQKALLRGAGHAWVSANLLLHNAVLVLLALAAATVAVWIALLGGVLVVAALLWRFANFTQAPRGSSQATR